MKRALELPKDDLKYYLEKIRRISRMSDEDALNELDEFLCSVVREQGLDLDVSMSIEDTEEETATVDGDSYEQDRQTILSHMRDLEASITELRRRIQRRELDSDSDEYCRIMLSTLDEIGISCGDEKALKSMEKEIEALQCRAREIVTEHDAERHKDKIKNAVEMVLSNPSTVSRLSRELDEAETFLKEEMALTEAVEAEIVKGRQRLAWYRAKKKMDEIEVAEGGGNRAKADRLRGEAQVLLKQDWRRYFPSASAPSLAECPEWA